MANEAKNFFDGYVEAALWSSTDESDERGGEPLDKNYSAGDLSAECARKMKSDCAKFIKANRRDLKEYAKRSKYGWSGAGHDFWLTRNGHGAGFWDRGMGELGDRLAKACGWRTKFGEVNLYVGDDGEIHCG